jgi:hypothetical protein
MTQDLSGLWAPKSDQLNADDLIGRDMVIKITRIAPHPDRDQELDVYYEGDGGKPWRPGKSMGRVLKHCWGATSDKWIGQSVHLFRDPEVTFGKLKVGGIRIKAITGIKGAQVVPLTVTRGRKAAYTVQPLSVAQQPPVIQESAGGVALITDAQAATIKGLLKKLPLETTSGFLRACGVPSVEALEAMRYDLAVKRLQDRIAALPAAQKAPEPPPEEKDDIPPFVLEGPPVEAREEVAA